MAKKTDTYTHLQIQKGTLYTVTNYKMQMHSILGKHRIDKEGKKFLEMVIKV